MATISVPKVLTYEEYLDTPEIKQRFEIINGVLEFMVPAPGKAHQWALMKLAILLDQAAKGAGQVYIAPFDVIISRTPLRTRQPDIFFVLSERLHIVGDRVEEGPDVVVEILSPSNRRKAVLEKLSDYARIGVKECWVVNLEGRTLEIWTNDGSTFLPTAAFAVGQEVRSAIFPVFELPAVVFDTK